MMAGKMEYALASISGATPTQEGFPEEAIGVRSIRNRTHLEALCQLSWAPYYPLEEGGGASGMGSTKREFMQLSG